MKAKSLDLLCTLSEYFSTYLVDVKGLSQNTVASYEYAFQLLYDFMNDVKRLPPEKVTFDSLSGGAIVEYLSWLEVFRGCSISTRNQRLAAISSFAKYAMRRPSGETLAFCSEVADIPNKKLPKTDDIKYFSLEEIAIMLSLPDTNRKIGQRDAVLMSVLYSSGARAQELCDLTLNDVVFGKETKLRLVGKGGKARTIVIPDNCAKLLKGFTEGNIANGANNTSRLKHVFSSQAHEKMSISCVEEIVKKYVRQAKAAYPALFRRASYSPHSFRHSIAVHMLEAGESLAVIRAFLGHASISSTMIYASVTPELANKYLSERGKPLETVGPIARQESIIASLPFLKRVSSNRTATTTP